MKKLHKAAIANTSVCDDELYAMLYFDQSQMGGIERSLLFYAFETRNSQHIQGIATFDEEESKDRGKLFMAGLGFKLEHHMWLPKRLMQNLFHMVLKGSIC